jgi:hypothetical protein
MPGGQPPGSRTSGPLKVARRPAYVAFEDEVHPVFAPPVVAGVRHPDLITSRPRLTADSFVVPDEAPEFVPGPLRRAARVTR